jgi:PKD repeat protein
MKIRLLVFFVCISFFFSCKKFVDTPERACFIPYVDFVAHHVDSATLAVNFTAITSFNGTISSHKWDFGDGTTFTGENPPPHLYPAPTAADPSHTYRIKYTVANDCGEAYWTHDITISNCLPHVRFGYTFLNDSTVQFTNQTTSASAVNYTWTFGDGTTSTAGTAVVTHVYRMDQPFTVILKGTNSCGDNDYTQNFSICRQPIPVQSITVGNCGAITVNGAASQNAAKYQWDFGNGVIQPASFGTSASMNYTYPAPGTYTVTLRVINSSGCDTSTVSNQVTVTGGSVANNNNWSYQSDDLDFIFSRETVSNATSYSWNFGDGTTSTAQNPGTKSYSNPGFYTVTLGASNACNSYSFSSTISAPYYKTFPYLPFQSFQDVVAVNPGLVYFLGTNGKLYKTDTAANWSAAINLPPGLVFNSDTRLFKDINNSLWIYGKNEIAQFNSSANTWTSYFAATGAQNGTTINSIAIDNSGNLWSVDDRQVRKGNNIVSSGTNNQYSSIAFAAATGRMWISSSNRNNLYYIPVTGGQFNTFNISGISGGAENIKVHPNGDVYFTIGNGMLRMNAAGILQTTYNSGTTNGQLTDRPADYDFDDRGNLWVVSAGHLYKIPSGTPSGIKNYSFTPDLNSIAAVSVLHLSGLDSDIILAKTSGNAAVKIK